MRWLLSLNRTAAGLLAPRSWLPLALAFAGGVTACTEQREEHRARDIPESGSVLETLSGRVVLASTTSVDDAGLLDVLVPAFEARYPGLELHVLAVGSGQALTLGRRGDADAVLVHDRAAESAFVANGYGVRRRTIMRNAFVIVGPPGDPAGIAGMAVLDALGRIARSAQIVGGAGATPIRFVSRGDSSGTHRREMALWRAAGVSPRGAWYREAGIGMGDLLRMASQQGAYSLTDLATYRFLQSDGNGAPALRLSVLVQGSARLDNPYSAIVARRARNPAGARALVDWLSGPEARALIDAYGRDRFGEPLFRPVAGATTR